jgi:hypothetical protein
MAREPKYKVCRTEWVYALQRFVPVEELVTRVSRYDAEVELKWKQKVEPNGSFGIFRNREKVYR